MEDYTQAYKNPVVRERMMNMMAQVQPYCSLDAREIRSDILAPGDQVEIETGWRESARVKVESVNLESREAKVILDRRYGPVSISLRRTKLVGTFGGKRKVDILLPYEARIQMLENKLRSHGIAVP